jgi:hypothetical protein
VPEQHQRLDDLGVVGVAARVRAAPTASSSTPTATWTRWKPVAKK